MTEKNLPRFTVIRDIQEKKGIWDFPESSNCMGTIVQHLKTADYTLQGMEEMFAIERKRTTAELSNNITEERFEREFERMDDLHVSFVICEFSMQDILDFPIGSTIPKRIWGKLRVNNSFLLKRVLELQTNHKAHWLFCDNVDNAKRVANGLFRIANQIINGKK